MATKRTLVHACVLLTCVQYYVASVGAVPYSASGLRQEIPTDIPLDVTVARLDGNNFTTIPPRAFSPYDQLYHLQLSMCRITSIAEDAFDGCPIRELWLSRNELVSFSQLLCLEALGPTLEVLHLGNNPYTDTIPPGAYGLEKLTELVLESSHLTQFPDLSALASPDKTEFTLDLYDNGVSSVTYNDLIPWQQQANLNLWLWNNQISSFPDVRGFDMADLTLTGNPLVCNTDMAWMKQPLSGPLSDWLYLDAAPCVAPDSLVGVSWEDITVDDLADVLLDDTNFTCVSMKTDRKGFRKYLDLRAQQPLNSVVPVVVLGEQLECVEDNNGLQFYTSPTEINTVECNGYQMGMQRCRFINAEPTMCHYECDCSVPGGCQTALLRKMRKGSPPIDGQICEVFIG